MGGTTVRQDLEGMDLTSLVEQAIADDEETEEGTYQGASNLEPQFEGSPEIERTDTAAESADRVLLVNIDFPQETVYIPDPNTGEFTGEKVQFLDGYLNTTREIADFVLQASPRVYEEPKEGGEPLVFTKTGFRTRNTEGYQRYIAKYYADQ